MSTENSGDETEFYSAQDGIDFSDIEALGDSLDSMFGFDDAFLSNLQSSLGECLRTEKPTETNNNRSTYQNESSYLYCLYSFIKDSPNYLPLEIYYTIIKDTDSKDIIDTQYNSLIKLPTKTGEIKTTNGNTLLCTGEHTPYRIPLTISNTEDEYEKKAIASLFPNTISPIMYNLGTLNSPENKKLKESLDIDKNSNWFYSTNSGLIYDFVENKLYAKLFGTSAVNIQDLRQDENFEIGFAVFKRTESNASSSTFSSSSNILGSSFDLVFNGKINDTDNINLLEKSENENVVGIFDSKMTELNYDVPFLYKHIPSVEKTIRYDASVGGRKWPTSPNFFDTLGYYKREERTIAESYDNYDVWEEKPLFDRNIVIKGIDGNGNVISSNNLISTSNFKRFSTSAYIQISGKLKIFRTSKNTQSTRSNGTYRFCISLGHIVHALYHYYGNRNSIEEVLAVVEVNESHTKDWYRDVQPVSGDKIMRKAVKYEKKQRRNEERQKEVNQDDLETPLDEYTINLPEMFVQRSEDGTKYTIIIKELSSLVKLFGDDIFSHLVSLIESEYQFQFDPQTIIPAMKSRQGCIYESKGGSNTTPSFIGISMIKMDTELQFILSTNGSTENDDIAKFLEVIGSKIIEYCRFLSVFESYSKEYPSLHMVKVTTSLEEGDGFKKDGKNIYKEAMERISMIFTTNKQHFVSGLKQNSNFNILDFSEYICKVLNSFRKIQSETGGTEDIETITEKLFKKYLKESNKVNDVTSLENMEKVINIVGKFPSHYITDPPSPFSINEPTPTPTPPPPGSGGLPPPPPPPMAKKLTKEEEAKKQLDTDIQKGVLSKTALGAYKDILSEIKLDDYSQLGLVKASDKKSSTAINAPLAKKLTLSELSTYYIEVKPLPVFSNWWDAVEFRQHIRNVQSGAPYPKEKASFINDFGITHPFKEFELLLSNSNISDDILSKDCKFIENVEKIMFCVGLNLPIPNELIETSTFLEKLWGDAFHLFASVRISLHGFVSKFKVMTEDWIYILTPLDQIDISDPKRIISEKVSLLSPEERTNLINVVRKNITQSIYHGLNGLKYATPYYKYLSTKGIKMFMERYKMDKDIKNKMVEFILDEKKNPADFNNQFFMLEFNVIFIENATFSEFGRSINAQIVVLQKASLSPELNGPYLKKLLLIQEKWNELQKIYINTQSDVYKRVNELVSKSVESLKFQVFGVNNGDNVKNIDDGLKDKIKGELDVLVNQDIKKIVLDIYGEYINETSVFLTESISDIFFDTSFVATGNLQINIHVLGFLLSKSASFVNEPIIMHDYNLEKELYPSLWGFITQIWLYDSPTFVWSTEITKDQNDAKYFDTLTFIYERVMGCPKMMINIDVPIQHEKILEYIDNFSHLPTKFYTQDSCDKANLKNDFLDIEVKEKSFVYMLMKYWQLAHEGSTKKDAFKVIQELVTKNYNLYQKEERYLARRTPVNMFDNMSEYEHPIMGHVGFSKRRLESAIDFTMAIQENVTEMREFVFFMEDMYSFEKSKFVQMIYKIFITMFFSQRTGNNAKFSTSQVYENVIKGFLNNGKDTKEITQKYKDYQRLLAAIVKNKIKDGTLNIKDIQDFLNVIGMFNYTDEDDDLKDENIIGECDKLYFFNASKIYETSKTGENTNTQKFLSIDEIQSSLFYIENDLSGIGKIGNCIVVKRKKDGENVTKRIRKPFNNLSSTKLILANKADEYSLSIFEDLISRIEFTLKCISKYKIPFLVAGEEDEPIIPLYGSTVQKVNIQVVSDYYDSFVENKISKDDNSSYIRIKQELVKLYDCKIDVICSEVILYQEHIIDLVINPDISNLISLKTNWIRLTDLSKAVLNRKSSTHSVEEQYIQDRVRSGKIEDNHLLSRFKVDFQSLDKNLVPWDGIIDLDTFNEMMTTSVLKNANLTDSKSPTDAYVNSMNILNSLHQKCMKEHDIYGTTFGTADIKINPNLLLREQSFVTPPCKEVLNFAKRIHKLEESAITKALEENKSFIGSYEKYRNVPMVNYVETLLYGMKDIVNSKHETIALKDIKERTTRKEMNEKNYWTGKSSDVSINGYLLAKMKDFTSSNGDIFMRFTLDLAIQILLEFYLEQVKISYDNEMSLSVDKNKLENEGNYKDKCLRVLYNSMKSVNQSRLKSKQQKIATLGEYLNVIKESQLNYLSNTRIGEPYSRKDGISYPMTWKEFTETILMKDLSSDIISKCVSS